jgi:hypothetical protein
LAILNFLPQDIKEFVSFLFSNLADLRRPADDILQMIGTVGGERLNYMSRRLAIRMGL